MVQLGPRQLIELQVVVFPCGDIVLRDHSVRAAQVDRLPDARRGGALLHLGVPDAPSSRRAGVDFEAEPRGVRVGSGRPSEIEGASERILEHLDDLCAQHAGGDQVVGEGKQRVCVRDGVRAGGDGGAAAARVLDGDVGVALTPKKCLSDKVAHLAAARVRRVGTGDRPALPLPREALEASRLLEGGDDRALERLDVHTLVADVLGSDRVRVDRLTHRRAAGDVCGRVGRDGQHGRAGALEDAALLVESDEEIAHEVRILPRRDHAHLAAVAPRDDRGVLTDGGEAEGAQLAWAEERV
mmetsp:Transcript_6060/g.12520  ORF Transcript_6060/g.12520 Transcript_6060/m.12520 type:complete len:298 (+) Transcript_6060:716-1609(+)